MLFSHGSKKQTAIILTFQDDLKKEQS